MIDRPPSSKAPDIQDGLPTSRLVGPKIDAHRLLQDERHAPGGEQRLQRPAVEEADDAALDDEAGRAGDEEGERQGDGERPVEQPGRGIADHLLHDEGRVGAEHHHLAMRHVDDAHHAEGDGEADRGEQQHRAERDAVPDVLAGLPQRERRIRSGRCRLRRRRGSARRRRRAAGAAAPARRGRPAPRSSRWRRPSRRPGGRRRGAPRRARAPWRRGPSASCSCGERRLERIERPRRRRAGRSSRRRVRRTAGSGLSSVSAADRGADGAAQPVVDRDLLQLAARRFAERLAGQRIDRGRACGLSALCADDDGAVGLARVEIAVASASSAGTTRRRRSRRCACDRRFRLVEAWRPRAPASSAAEIVLRQARARVPRTSSRRSGEQPGEHDIIACMSRIREAAPRAGLGPAASVPSGRQEPWPPHLPVSTLKFPQSSGARQSEISTLDSGR